MEMDTIEQEIGHAPLRPPRADVIGEMVMHDQWQKQVTKAYESHDGASIFDAILWSLNGNAGQREATVCATFMVWLGANNGRAFLSRARETHNILKPFMNGYLATWANENHRTMSINNGCRQLELILTQQRTNASSAVLGNLTLRDYEIIDVLVEWLSKRHGQDFLAACEKDIAKRLAAQRLEALARAESRSKQVSNG